MENVVNESGYILRTLNEVRTKLEEHLSKRPITLILDQYGFIAEAICVKTKTIKFPFRRKYSGYITYTDYGVPFMAVTLFKEKKTIATIEIKDEKTIFGVLINIHLLTSPRKLVRFIKLIGFIEHHYIPVEELYHLTPKISLKKWNMQ